MWALILRAVTLNVKNKALRKCPFCRSAIKSKALNIILQDLIRTSKEQDVTKSSKPLTLKENVLQSNFESMEYFEILNSTETQQLRKEIMEEERAERAQKSAEIQSQINAKYSIIDKLREEERDCMERLEKVKKELNFTRDFIEQQEMEIEKLKSDKKNYDKPI
uniref:Uncharacterized protein n=1 Tax=Euplotes crassus TaxID=5936 RepID=A0A7S3KRP5_EUPCR|mmetsp:Transcript_35979/g.35586  ORF Transcript_35979/g.35586 Transcript_35979/m.35586 type:complete len:164 (+) Transcript_35979:327-818(+)|eukprot:CAMPEP_0197011034 /NCGR_PEP_ID=MMETSP1380-20130617/56857_1 /TAXON_ID=5936 /ORGANISM="Euplotes crassus, Strain CT5" /LENGTH=163 /DNA_ID=CAMNT_0042433393 /DNA_START=321 /DNA_END=812 /DNA_ORIENTATION=-